MLFNVPQYIDVEDKVAGPLTAKQLLWMFGMGVVLIILWNIFDGIVFFIVAIPAALIFCALAFYRPYKQPLIKFVGSSLMYFFRPKVYSWRRIPQAGGIRKQEEKKKEVEVKEEKKMLAPEDLTAMAKMLDSAGEERNQRIMEIIKKNKKKANK